MFVEVETKIQSPEGPVKQTFHVRSEAVSFVFKPPLQTVTMVVTDGGPMPTHTPFAAIVEKLPGFVALATPEGVDAYVNPSRVLCYTMQTIGTLVLMFPGGGKLIVKESKADLERKLGGSSLII